MDKELPAITNIYEDVDSKEYNYIDQDEILNEPQNDEQTSAGTLPEAADDPLGNAMHDPGPSQQTEDGDSTSAGNIWGRLKSYKCPRPRLPRVIAIAMSVAALLGAGACVFMFLTFMINKHGETADPSVKEYPNERLLESRMLTPSLSKMTPAQDLLATTLPDNTTGLPRMTGVISTDKRDKSGNPIQKETALATTAKDWAFARPPPARGDSPGRNIIYGPRCKNGYKLLVGTCIKLFSAVLNVKSHGDAKKACRKEGATLAMPKTEQLDAALRHEVKTEGGNKEHWIGMEEKRGTWCWVDGSVVDNNGYKGWNPGEPSNPRWLGALCGQYWEKPRKSSGWFFRRTGYVMWDDDECYKLKNFICQRLPA
ncbi:hypothetical protein Bbelb_055350 [Branchiostoma belcheri]|nr:hypothetical protein Bbelb_055350 [Branchiostoma belcheri]